MNVNKFIATLIVKNHNNGIFSANDAIIRDRMYSRVSAAIELAKSYQLEITALDDRFIVKHDTAFDTGNFKPITIYKRHVHCGEVSDFFFGLKRSHNPVAFLSWFKHTNEDKFFYLVNSDGATRAGICSASHRKHVKGGEVQFHASNQSN